MESVFATPGVPGQPRTRRSLLGAALRRPGGRRALSVLSIVLAIAGVAMFAFPAYTDFIAHLKQGNLKSQFSSPELQEAYISRKFNTGQALTRLTSKEMGIDVLVVEGTTPSALKAGAGHYPATALPCEPGNVGIAGHRTTYGRPFNTINEMKAGNLVYLETPFETCEYVVVPAFGGHANPWIVDPNDFGVVDQPQDGSRWLTLTSCHPKGSAAKRIVLRLKFVKTTLKPGFKKSSPSK
ncbi:MAG: sortase [Frankiales bacterium]|jgi:sortase A|nr:sortase [Frankiales bacterium]